MSRKKLEMYNKKYEDLICKLKEERQTDTDTAWEAAQTGFEGIVRKYGSGKLEEIEEQMFFTRLAQTPAQKLFMLVSVLYNQFDVDYDLWNPIPLKVLKESIKVFLSILDILTQYPNITLSYNFWSAEETKKTGGGDIHLQGDLKIFAERLYFEFYSGLRYTDPHTPEYLDRLGEEPMLYLVLQNVMKCLVKRDDFRSAAKVAYLLLSIVNEKPIDVYRRMRDFVGKKECAESGDRGAVIPFVVIPKLVTRVASLPDDSRTLVDDLACFIDRYGDEENKRGALLREIYYFAMMDNLSHSSLLRIRYQDQAHSDDIFSQVEFNRATAQLGLCAFRTGHIEEAHRYLSELYAGGKIEEQLAQGIIQSPDKTPVEEMWEQGRQKPHHMHIDLELLKAVHLISAMLIEVPHRAANTREAKVISKKCLLEVYERQAPPQNVGEHIMAATKALSKGDFRKSLSILKSLDVWKLLRNRDKVLEMLTLYVKEVALKTYLFSYFYDSLSLEQLSTRFELSRAHTHISVIKLLNMEELQDVKYTRLRAFALQLTEISPFVAESNGKACDNSPKLTHSESCFLELPHSGFGNNAANPPGIALHYLPCLRCPKISRTEKGCISHLKVVHNFSSDDICEVFSTSKGHDRHMKVHGPWSTATRPHQCQPSVSPSLDEPSGSAFVSF